TAHCEFTPRTARTYMRIARLFAWIPPPPPETSCRAALLALSQQPGRKRPRARPTPDEVADRMREFGVPGDVANVILLLRAFGVKVRSGSALPLALETGPNGSALPLSSTGNQAINIGAELSDAGLPLATAPCSENQRRVYPLEIAPS